MASYTDIDPGIMFYDETCQIKLLDEFGDLATATIQSGSPGIQPVYSEDTELTYGQACGDTVLNNYVQALNMQMFFNDALVGWGDQSEDLDPFTEFGAATWVEPDRGQLA